MKRIIGALKPFGLTVEGAQSEGDVRVRAGDALFNLLLGCGKPCILCVGRRNEEDDGTKEQQEFPIVQEASAQSSRVLKGLGSSGRKKRGPQNDTY